MKVLKLIMLIVLIGCGDYDNLMNSNEETAEPYYVPLNVYMNHPLDINGYYMVDYPNGASNWYTEVLFKSIPTQRCYWGSDTQFETYYQNQIFYTDIINYSTYSGNDSIGHQFIYLYEQFIGDTLMVGCCISDENCDGINFIVH